MLSHLEKYTVDLVERDGIYFSHHSSPVSYPQSGNEACFQIENNSFWFKHRNNCIVEAVKKYAPNSLFFDVGGGNGFVAMGLQDAGIQTVLVEPGIHGCLNAKKRGLSTVVCSTFENASFKNSSLPAVGLFDVVEHIEQDHDFLKRVHTYLAVKGFVFITVPAYNSLWSNEDRDAGHFRRYTLSKLEKLVETSGFSIVYSTYIFSVLPFPIFFSRALPSRLGLNKKSHALDKHIQEHKPKKGAIDSLLNRVWQKELAKISKEKKIRFGGSCMLVAQKTR
ncbi:MAG TPA: methyltransferase domain-containing protein [Flavobacteriales bacterium]|nr:methyltransferase domain-containing protein [Flavobacteriales bacterium]